MQSIGMSHQNDSRTFPGCRRAGDYVLIIYLRKITDAIGLGGGGGIFKNVVNFSHLLRHFNVWNTEKYPWHPNSSCFCKVFRHQTCIRLSVQWRAPFLIHKTKGEKVLPFFGFGRPLIACVKKIWAKHLYYQFRDGSSLYDPTLVQKLIYHLVFRKICHKSLLHWISLMALLFHLWSE